jgi:hypothetical protein
LRTARQDRALKVPVSPDYFNDLLIKKASHRQREAFFVSKQPGRCDQSAIAPAG